jgi:ADP-ribosylglycohydrolase
VANAGDPRGAYAEAIDIAGAHQSSYGREAAGVHAAAVAAAMAPGATADDVLTACLELARDGTRAAIAAVAAAAEGQRDWQAAIPVLRAAVAPYDSVGPAYREPGLDARRPSRLHSVEELPVALGFVLVAAGGYRDAVLGAVNYGRDADSIATMAGGITGALGGAGAVPRQWCEQVSTASRLDLETPGRVMAAVATEMLAADERRHAARQRSMRALLDSGS